MNNLTLFKEITENDYQGILDYINKNSTNSIEFENLFIQLPENIVIKNIDLAIKYFMNLREQNSSKSNKKENIANYSVHNVISKIMDNFINSPTKELLNIILNFMTQENHEKFKAKIIPLLTLKSMFSIDYKNNNDHNIKFFLNSLPDSKTQLEIVQFLNKDLSPNNTYSQYILNKFNKEQLYKENSTLFLNHILNQVESSFSSEISNIFQEFPKITISDINKLNSQLAYIFDNSDRPNNYNEILEIFPHITKHLSISEKIEILMNLFQNISLSEHVSFYEIKHLDSDIIESVPVLNYLLNNHQSHGDDFFNVVTKKNPEELNLKNIHNLFFTNYHKLPIEWKENKKFLTLIFEELAINRKSLNNDNKSLFYKDLFAKFSLNKVSQIAKNVKENNLFNEFLLYLPSSITLLESLNHPLRKYSKLPADTYFNNKDVEICLLLIKTKQYNLWKNIHIDVFNNEEFLLEAAQIIDSFTVKNNSLNSNSTIFNISYLPEPVKLFFMNKLLNQPELKLTEIIEYSLLIEANNTIKNVIPKLKL